MTPLHSATHVTVVWVGGNQKAKSVESLFASWGRTMSVPVIGRNWTIVGNETETPSIWQSMINWMLLDS